MRYRGVGPVIAAAPGSVDAWLTERYVMYAAGDSGAVYRSDIHHLPWQLREGAARIDAEGISRSAGIALDPTPSLLHFAEAQDALIWAPAAART